MKIQLYCLTCKRSDMTYEEQVEQVCANGADAVQFRDKTLSAKEILHVGQKLKEICHERNVLFILNDRPDLALALDADGVHLGLDDIPITWARQILGGRKIIGCTASSLGQAMTAAKEGAGYVTVGPIFEPSQRTAEAARGVDILRMVKERVKIPVIAIGGISEDNADEAIKSGADGVGVSRAICGAPSVALATQKIKQRITEALKSL